MLLRFQKAAVRKKHETGNQAFSIRLRFLNTRGVDGQSLPAFSTQLSAQLARLEKELKDNTYQPQPVWSHRLKRWRKRGWKQLPASQLYGEYELVRLVALIPSLAPWFR